MDRMNAKINANPDFLSIENRVKSEILELVILKVGCQQARSLLVQFSLFLLFNKLLPRMIKPLTVDIFVFVFSIWGLDHFGPRTLFVSTLTTNRIKYSLTTV